MTRQQWLLLGLGGAIIAYLIYKRQAITSAAQTGYASVQAAISGWQNTEEGPTWVPVINQAEQTYGIPTNLLARQAYEESHFIPSVIDGTQASSAGALGILQLMPQYFTSVQVPVPFSKQDTLNQINQAAQYMASLYSQFGDWGDALAAYNAGPGTINQVLAGTATLPTQTRNYVTQILADVPVMSASSVPALNA